MEERLYGPGFPVASILPKKGSGLVSGTLFQQALVETFFELQSASGDSRRIAGLSRLPAMRIARLEFRLWIAGLARLEFGVLRDAWAPTWIVASARWL